MDRVLMFTGVAEAVTGVLLLVVPSLVSRVLFGVDVAGSGAMFAQLAGIALIGLGIACWPGPAALGVLVYGVVVALFLVWMTATQGIAGPLLWPAIILHAALIVPLSMAIKKRRAADE